MENETRIYDKLDDIHSDVNDIKLKQVGMAKDVEQNTKDLAEHIEGVIQNRERIAILEEERRFPKKVGDILIKAGKIIGGGAIIVGLIKALLVLML